MIEVFATSWVVEKVWGPAENVWIRSKFCALFSHSNLYCSEKSDDIHRDLKTKSVEFLWNSLKKSWRNSSDYSMWHCQKCVGKVGIGLFWLRGAFIDKLTLGTLWRFNDRAADDLRAWSADVERKPGSTEQRLLLWLLRWQWNGLAAVDRRHVEPASVSQEQFLVDASLDAAPRPEAGSWRLQWPWTVLATEGWWLERDAIGPLLKLVYGIHAQWLEGLLDENRIGILSPAAVLILPLN